MKEIKSGQSSANGDQIKEVSREKYATKDFYMSTLKFTEDKWNFANVTEQGYPTLYGLKEQNRKSRKNNFRHCRQARR